MGAVPFTIVDDAASLSAALTSLNKASPTAKPFLYLDLEGISLSRHGSISILQIYQLEQDHVYLIDVHTLGAAAFNIKSGDSSTTLKGILENEAIAKAFFDVRNDSDALYNLHGVYLQGVVDLQLMELTTRLRSRRLLNGLGRCLESYFAKSQMILEAAEWTQAKQAGLWLFAPERRGNYEVFNVRPMRQAIIDYNYCIQDVTFLPMLYDDYSQNLSPTWVMKLDREAQRRVAVCQQSSYLPHGRQKVLAPAFM